MSTSVENGGGGIKVRWQKWTPLKQDINITRQYPPRHPLPCHAGLDLAGFGGGGKEGYRVTWLAYSLPSSRSDLGSLCYSTNPISSPPDLARSLLGYLSPSLPLSQTGSGQDVPNLSHLHPQTGPGQDRPYSLPSPSASEQNHRHQWKHYLPLYYVRGR